MKTLLYLNGTYCNSLESLKRIFDQNPSITSILGKDILAAQRDGILAKWLNEGGPEEKKIGSRIGLLSGSDSNILHNLLTEFGVKTSVNRPLFSQCAEFDNWQYSIDNKQWNNIDCSLLRLDNSNLRKLKFKITFKVESSINEEYNLTLRVKQSDSKLVQVGNDKLKLNASSRNNIITTIIDNVDISKIDLVGALLEIVIDDKPIKDYLVRSPERVPIKINDYSFDMIYIKGNKYIPDYYLAEIPFTGAIVDKMKQYNSLIASNLQNLDLASLNNDNQCPLSNVTMRDISVLINAVSQITRCQFRLPSREEWVYACNEGMDSMFLNVANPQELGWFNCAGKHPVKKGRKPNEFGLYDMIGNVWEFTSTHQDYLYTILGGSYKDLPNKYKEEKIQNANVPDKAIGFRLACSEEDMLKYVNNEFSVTPIINEKPISNFSKSSLNKDINESKITSKINDSSKTILRDTHSNSESHKIKNNKPSSTIPNVKNNPQLQSIQLDNHNEPNVVKTIININNPSSPNKINIKIGSKEFIMVHILNYKKDFYLAETLFTGNLYPELKKYKSNLGVSLFNEVESLDLLAPLNDSLYPLTNVSMNDILIIIRGLSKITNCTFRLPTFSEWIYAGNEGRSDMDLYIRDPRQYGRFDGDHKLYVKTRQPNSLGLYDMVGNVWEFTSSVNSQNNYICLGGAYDCHAYQYREKMVCDGVSYDKNIGFRLACDADQILKYLNK